MLNCIIATMRPNSGMKAPRTPTSFISLQRPLGVVVAEEEVEEDAIRLAVLAEGVVDQRQARGDAAQRVGVDRDAGGQSLVEEAEDVDRVLLEGGLVGEVEAAVLDPVGAAGCALAEGEGRLQAAAEVRPRLGVAGLEAGEEDAGEIADVLGVPEVVLHEALDGALALGRGVAERRGDLDLGVEGQLLAGAAVQKVEVDAGRPQEGLGLGEDVVFVGGEDADLDEVVGRLGAVQVLGDPEQGLEVAQAALALLDVGLEQVAGAALAGVALGALGELELDELGPGGAEVRPRDGRGGGAPGHRHPRDSGARGGWCGR